MCGIYCGISCHGRILPPPETLLAKLESRGPDAIQQHVVRVESAACCLTFVSSVLSLRGRRVVEQPLVDPATDSVLCWNGEAWSIGGAAVTGNDSEAVFRLLLEAAGESHRSIIDTFSRIRGPFSCIFYDGRRNLLFFGRDILGRRSMVKSMTHRGDFILCSVPHPDSDATWTEVEADGMYVVSLSEASVPKDGADSIAIHHYPITYQANHENSQDCIVSQCRLLFQKLLTLFPESSLWSIK
jgi:asparagine synthetase B (glutamine-hydrolysing)